MRYTIGYISHDPAVFSRYLLPSIAALHGAAVIDSTSDVAMPAHNYNTMLSRCETPFLILSHEDMSFSADLLECIDRTIDLVPDFGVLGHAGPGGAYSSSGRIYGVDTLDGCFIVIRPSLGIRFDGELFGEYHLYVEDYCARAARECGRANYTILIDSCDDFRDAAREGSYLVHHGATVRQRGFAWGKYWHYRRLLEARWPGVRTT